MRPYGRGPRMLWRVRTTLPDRPGALAELARSCGEAGVNILGMQIFPGVTHVTDELVLRVPDDWGIADLAELVEAAGGQGVTGVPCTEEALLDQPTRYVQAARTILAQPAAFPEVVAQLFDAESDPDEDGLAAIQDVMEMTVRDVAVQVRRTAPFTATEHARGAALAGLVDDVLRRGSEHHAGLVPAAGRRAGPGAAPSYVVHGNRVAALVAGTTVGVGVLSGRSVEDGARAGTLQVDPAWRRRGIGTRLLGELARMAAAAGLDEVVLTTTVDNQAVLPLVLASGLRARIRMSADGLTVRIPVRQLRSVAV
jgi:GNAT superfamily N-acetyltransferase